MKNNGIFNYSGIMRPDNFRKKIYKLNFYFQLFIFIIVFLFTVMSKSVECDVYAAERDSKLFQLKQKIENEEYKEPEVSVEVEKEESPHAVTDRNAKMPFAVKTTPADGEANAPINTQIKIMFSKPMDYLTINKSSFMVMDEVGSSVDGNVTYDAASYVATFTPAAALSKNSTFSVFVPAYLVKDAEGYQLDKNLSVSFKTEGDTENTAKIYESRKSPKVVRTSPDVNAADVALDSYIMADFTMPLSQQKIADSTIVVNDGIKDISGKTVYVEKDNQLMFIPDKNLETGKVYRVNITARDIESIDGFKLPQNYSWSFSTRKPRDEAPPEVVSVSPINGSYDVSEQARIAASFSEEIEPTTLNKYTVTLSENNQDVNGKIIYDRRTLKAAFVPYEKLKLGQKYTMIISTAVKDMAGNPMKEPVQWSFFTKKPIVVEKPKIVKTFPASDEKNIKIDTKIFIYFNKSMNESTCNVFNVKLSAGDKVIPVSTNFIKNGNFVTIIPLENLEYSTVYKISVSGRISDNDQQQLGSDYQASFTTMEKPDTTPPEIVKIIPEDNALSVALNSIISVSFTEPIAKGSISASCISVKNEKGIRINGSLNFDESDNVLTFIPEAKFEYMTKYVVALTDSIKDRAGNRLRAGKTWSFTTLMAPDITPPKVISCFPKNLEKQLAVNTTVQIIFSERLKEGVVNNKTIVLYDENGTETPAAVTYDAIMRRATITPRRNLEYSTNYKIVVTKIIQDMAGNGMRETFVSQFKTLAAPDRTRPELASACPEAGAINVSLDTSINMSFTKKLDPLTVTNKNIFLRNENTHSDVAIEISYNDKLKQIDIIPHEKLSYSTTYQLVLSRGVTDSAGNLFDSTIVVEFTTKDAPDVTPPEIKKTVPANQAKNVSVDSSIVISFTKKLKDSTITERNITLLEIKDGAQSEIFCKIAYQEKDLKIVVTPISKLKYASAYKLLIKSISDTAGNLMKEMQSVYFNTEEEPDTEPPSVKECYPKNKAANISVKTELYLKFNEPVEPETLNLDNLKLTVNKTNVEFEALYQPESNSVVIKPVKPLEYDKLYTFEAVNEISDLAGNKMLASYVFQFRTCEVPDYEKPKINSIQPLNGSLGVTKSAQIQVYFSKKLKPASVNKFTFFVNNDQSGEQVDGKIHYDEAKNCAVFMPREDLRDGITYRAKVTEGVTDKAGNPLEKGISWAFTVGQPKDNTKLMLVSSYPKDNELNLACDCEIALTFNKSINESTVNEYTVFLTDGSRRVAGEISLGASGKKVLLKPKSKLKPGTLYILTATTGIEDEDSNPLSKKVRLTFKTK
ncbi:MAG: Ig-like domain-containing protein [Candidatus Wallbacteria bacterium]